VAPINIPDVAKISNICQRYPWRTCFS